jgi:hypothetical protein
MESNTKFLSFRERQLEDPTGRFGSRPEFDPGETVIQCEICGYYGIVPKREVPVDEETTVGCIECGVDALLDGVLAAVNDVSIERL